MPEDSHLIRWFSDLGRADVARVGGKNASLGELSSRLGTSGIPVPEGFATTAEAYWLFVDANGLSDRIAAELARLGDDGAHLADVGKSVREMILAGSIPDELARAISDAYARLANNGDHREPSVAVRSSATAEDLPEASFAGQLESFLNVSGTDGLLDACRRCFASLFTDRAITYRENNGFEHMQVALSVGVQRMVRSDLGAAGVMFTIDTETGFPHVVLINASWGLGETVVQGIVDPDEFYVFKPLLATESVAPIVDRTLGSKAQKMIYGRDPQRPTRLVRTRVRDRHRFALDDAEVLCLARWACAIERHYGQPMDIEWAKDGVSGELFIVQARPETVQSRRDIGVLKSYRLEEAGKRLLSGHAVGDSIAAGRVRRLESPEQIDELDAGEVLVTRMTDPDWVPIMRKAAAIVTDHGGRTSHAAIVSRELGLTAVVGTENATRLLRDGEEVTVSCAEGDTGYVYRGQLKFVAEETNLDAIPETRTQVMLNMANPAAAYRWWRLPADGVGLVRTEFVVGNLIKIHPMALVHPERVVGRGARRRIKALTVGYARGEEYFIDKLASGVARIASAYHPKPVIVRMSDFKTNEYAELIGGRGFEPREENPMLGWRGASRYYSEQYRDGFALECRALRRAREEIGLDNIIVMIPFCRTLEEADLVLAELGNHGLVRGRNGLEVYVMAELPANVVLATEFAERFDGFSIGSNDLTQLTLGVDRDSDILSGLFDERNKAVTRSISALLSSARATRTKTGLCGQAPSDHPEFAAFLVDEGIDSISVSPDSFLAVKREIAAAERSSPHSAELDSSDPVTAALDAR
jgi:pyruvate,water dikinase